MNEGYYYHFDNGGLDLHLRVQVGNWISENQNFLIIWIRSENWLKSIGLTT